MSANEWNSSTRNGRDIFLCYGLTKKTFSIMLFLGAIVALITVQFFARVQKAPLSLVVPLQTPEKIRSVGSQTETDVVFQNEEQDPAPLTSLPLQQSLLVEATGHGSAEYLALYDLAVDNLPTHRDLEVKRFRVVNVNWDALTRIAQGLEAGEARSFAFSLFEDVLCTFTHSNKQKINGKLVLGGRCSESIASNVAVSIDASKSKFRTTLIIGGRTRYRAQSITDQHAVVYELYPSTIPTD